MTASSATSANRAAFLSYASEDAGKARLICEALRAAGVEVWFDQNDLRGGDAWDRKIRRQIQECSLFVPVISAHTQARAEGYFRLEWKLAVDRSHLMADDTPFIVPVAIDNTPESIARVPDKFREMQWIRLEGPESLPAFGERLRDLLGGERNEGGSTGHGRSAQAIGTAKRASKLVPLIIVAIGMGYAGRLFWLRFRSVETNPRPAPTAAPHPEARERVAKARALYEPWDGATREDFALAEKFAKSAIELDETDADGWATQAVIAGGQIILGYDRSRERYEAARVAAERAVKLAPGSGQARFAQALYFRLHDTTRAEAERMLKDLAASMPTDKLVLRTFGDVLRDFGRTNEAVAVYDRAARLPGGDAVALYHKFLTLAGAQRHAEAEAALEQSLAVQSSSYGYRAKAMALMMWHGDLDGAAAAIAKVSPAFLLEDSGVFWASRVWLWRREPDTALATLKTITRDTLGGEFDGPTTFLAGLAHELAGRREAARVEWRAALGVTERQLAAQPNARRWLHWKALVLACLDEKTEAERVLRTLQELSGSRGVTFETIEIHLRLGRPDTVLSALEEWFNPIIARGNTGEIATRRSQLRFDPLWDPLRGIERFEALRRRFEDDRPK